MTLVVGDLGGTNVRFALAEGARLEAFWSSPCSAFESPVEALEVFLADAGSPSREGVCLGVAGPISDGRATMVNLAWSLDGQDLKRLGFSCPLLIGDFDAVAFALPHLGEDQVDPIGQPRGRSTGLMAVVVGPGTGFGVAAVRDGAVISSQGGHVGFAPVDELDRAVAAYLARSVDPVQIEHILSGPGLERLHQALTGIGGAEARLSAAEIAARAGAGEPACLRTARRFWRILGSVAGDFALAFEARGGVFITGGVARSLQPFLDGECFRAAFEAKGDLSRFNAGIGAWTIREPRASLIGAAAAWRRAYCTKAPDRDRGC